MSDISTPFDIIVYVIAQKIYTLCELSLHFMIWLIVHNKKILVGMNHMLFFFIEKKGWDITLASKIIALHLMQFVH